MKYQNIDFPFFSLFFVCIMIWSPWFSVIYINIQLTPPPLPQVNSCMYSISWYSEEKKLHNDCHGFQFNTSIFKFFFKRKVHVNLKIYFREWLKYNVAIKMIYDLDSIMLWSGFSICIKFKIKLSEFSNELWPSEVLTI